MQAGRTYYVEYFERWLAPGEDNTLSQVDITPWRSGLLYRALVKSSVVEGQKPVSSMKGVEPSQGCID